MATDGGEGKQAPAGRPAGERQMLTAAVMALTVVAGVGLVLVFPKPEPSSPVELARPAPVSTARAPSWPLPAPLPPKPAPVQTAGAPATAEPPLRTRRLEMAQAARPHPIVRAERVSAACRSPKSAADRLVCARPALAGLDVEMRQAYDRALAAGADRLSVDRAQAKWRGRRDRATSEDELSELYARRITELDRAARIKAPGGAMVL